MAFSRASIVKVVVGATAGVVMLSVLRPAKAQSESAQYPVASAARVAAWIEASARKLDYAPGEVLIKFRDGVGQGGQQRALMALRSRPDVGQMKWIGNVAWLRDASQPDARILAEQLSSQPEVEYAEPNYIRRLACGAKRPVVFAPVEFQRHQHARRLGHHRRREQRSDRRGRRHRHHRRPAQNLNARTWSGSAIVTTSAPVAPSPDFNTSRFVSPMDFTVDPASSVVVDTDGHGTHVAGTIGEDSNNNVALAGIAYNARIMPVKVCMSYWDIQFARSAAGIPGFSDDAGGCFTSDIIQGIRYAADNGAKVINISLGGTFQSQAERSAIEYAVGRGAFVAISNGNDFLDGNPVSYPAAFAAQINGAMSVAATNQVRGQAAYSSTGPHTEIAAPGGDNRQGGSAGMIWQVSLLPGDSSSLCDLPAIRSLRRSQLPGHVDGVAARRRDGRAPLEPRHSHPRRHRIAHQADRHRSWPSRQGRRLRLRSHSTARRALRRRDQEVGRDVEASDDDSDPGVRSRPGDADGRRQPGSTLALAAEQTQVPKPAPPVTPQKPPQKPHDSEAARPT